MPQLLLRPIPFLARWPFIVLAVTMLLLLSAMLVQAEQSQLPDRSDETVKSAPKPAAGTQLPSDPNVAQPQVTTRRPGSRAGGAYWAEPWQEDGPKVLNTRRSVPPTVQPMPAPSLGSPERIDPNQSTLILPPVNYTEFDRYPFIQYGGNYYHYRHVHPGVFGPVNPFVQGRFWAPFPAGRGTISAGRGDFWEGRPGFRGYNFRGGHPGFQYRGFRGR